jgi:hypothetical protein
MPDQGSDPELPSSVGSVTESMERQVSYGASAARLDRERNAQKSV